MALANGWATIGGTSSAYAHLGGDARPGQRVVVLLDGPGHLRQRAEVPDAGFASPILYGIAANATAYAASFNNVTSGNNDVYGLDNGLFVPRPGRLQHGLRARLPQAHEPDRRARPGLLHVPVREHLQPAPEVTELNPGFGTVAGGYTVTVTGSGFGTADQPS